VEIVGIADVNPAALETVGERFHVKGRYTDYATLLDTEKPDLVSVCSWPELHAPMTLAAVEAGVKGVLCEKPLARTLGEANRMVRACEAAGVKFAGGYQHRFNPLHILARQLIADGAIGQPITLRSRTNRGLTNNGSHGVDLMRFLLGDPQAEWVVGQVGRSTDRWERGGRIEDFGVGLIGFPGDAQGTITTDLPGNPDFYPSILGTDGSLALHGDRLRLINASGITEESVTQSIGEHAAEIAEMVEWMRGGPEHRSQARNARAAIEILMALYESARTHERIDLPLMKEDSPLEQMIGDGMLPVKVPGEVHI
jgi:predicted dehydrogenase